MMTIVKYPDLMIYLKAEVPHLVQNIQRRGRDYEQTMPIDYLENLNTRYNEFIYDKYEGPKLVIDVDDMDFQHEPKDFAYIVDQIDQNLFSLFK